MSYRQKHNGRWTEWSKSEVEVGDTIRMAMGVSRIRELFGECAVSNNNLAIHIKHIASIVHKGGDPRRHPRFVPVVPVPQFPATDDGRTKAYQWAKTDDANDFEVDRIGDPLSGFCPAWHWSMRGNNYRIRRIGETVDYPLFVEAK